MAFYQSVKNAAVCVHRNQVLLLRAFALTLFVAAPASAQMRPYAPGTPQFGIGGTPDAPTTAVLRSDEDWSPRPGAPDGAAGLRWVPIGDDLALSFGVDVELRHERYDNGGFGMNPGEDGIWNVRINPQVGLSYGDRLRFYVSQKYGHLGDSRFPVATAEDDGPDLHEGFVEVTFGDVLGLATKDAFLRVGRQELHYGGGRLFSIRNGPNVRDDFDGAVFRIRAGGAVTDVFAAYGTEDDPGSFNNDTERDQRYWGIYSSRPLQGDANVDLYYFGYHRKQSPYAFATEPVTETRHTFGARLWSGGNPRDGWGYDIDFGLQTGHATAEGRGLDILAGYLAGYASYGFGDTLWTPTLQLRGGASTGDDDPDDGTLGTFRAPAPPGKYFGDASDLGPGNIAFVGLYGSVQPIKSLTVTAGGQVFHRIETEDGLYNPPQLSLTPATGGSHDVGREVSITATYNVTPMLQLFAEYAHFTAGDYLEDASPGRDIDYTEMGLSFKY